MRLARAAAPRGGVRLGSERGAVGVRRVARILARVVGVGPFGRVRLAHRGVERVVGVAVARVIVGIAPWGLRKARRRLALLADVVGAHSSMLPGARGGKRARGGETTGSGDERATAGGLPERANPQVSSGSGYFVSRLRSISLPCSAPLRLSPCARRKNSVISESPSRSASWM